LITEENVVMNEGFGLMNEIAAFLENYRNFGW